MTTLDVFLCLALTNRLNPGNHAMWETAKRLRARVEPRSDAARIVDMVLRSKHPCAVVALALEGIE